MLELIALIFLSKQIGKLATKKGLRPGLWKLYLILSWISGELAGIVLAVAVFGKENLVGVLLIGLCGAFGGYLLIKYTIDKIPDIVIEDIDRIGIDDLRPPRRSEP